MFPVYFVLGKTNYKNRVPNKEYKHPHSITIWECFLVLLNTTRAQLVLAQLRITRSIYPGLF